MSVFVYKNVFGKEGKCVENVQAESRTQESLLFVFFQSGGAWGLLQPRHALQGGTPYKAAGGPSRVTTYETPQMGLILTPLERS